MVKMIREVERTSADFSKNYGNIERNDGYTHPELKNMPSMLAELSRCTGNYSAYRIWIGISRQTEFKGVLQKPASTYSGMIPSDKFVRE